MLLVKPPCERGGFSIFQCFQGVRHFSGYTTTGYLVIQPMFTSVYADILRLL